MNDVIKKNLRTFREEAGLTTNDVAQTTGIPVDNLRRYEGGKSGVPADVLRKLADVYGHAMEHFFMESPPKADLSSRPMFHLSTLPGMDVDEKRYRDLLEIVNRTNAEIRAKRTKK